MQSSKCGKDLVNVGHSVLAKMKRTDPLRRCTQEETVILYYYDDHVEDGGGETACIKNLPWSEFCGHEVVEDVGDVDNFLSMDAPKGSRQPRHAKVYLARNGCRVAAMKISRVEKGASKYWFIYLYIYMYMYISNTFFNYSCQRTEPNSNVTGSDCDAVQEIVALMNDDLRNAMKDGSDRDQAFLRLLANCPEQLHWRNFLDKDTVASWAETRRPMSYTQRLPPAKRRHDNVDQQARHGKGHLPSNAIERPSGKRKQMKVRECNNRTSSS